MAEAPRKCQPLTQERLKAVLHYDPETGVFSRRKATAKRGTKVGDVMANGYLRIGIDNGRYLAHRLAWLYMTGSWPKFEGDHRNRIRTDNRWTNLRDATPSENQHNRGVPIHNTSGHQGVSWCSRTKRWVAQICVRRERKFLGRYDSLTEAVAVRQAAKQQLHPTAPL